VPAPTAVTVRLTATERHRLKKLSRSHTMPHRLVVRAQIVRLAAASYSNAAIAVRLGVHVDTVRTWRGRFAAGGIAALNASPSPAAAVTWVVRVSHQNSIVAGDDLDLEVNFHEHARQGCLWILWLKASFRW
jgi:hypothetical protein